MKKFYSFLCIAAMLLAVQACDDDDDPVKSDSTSSSTEQGSGTDSGSDSGSGTTAASISVSPTSLAFDEDGGTKTVTLTLTGDDTWTAEPDDTWITVSPSTGTATTTVSITVEENYSATGAERVGSVVFRLSSNTGNTGVSITQTGAVELEESIYYYDDFEWLDPYAVAAGCDDPISKNTNDTSGSIRIDRASYGDKTAQAALAEYGYVFKEWMWDEDTDTDGVTANQESVFLCANYLKFGKQDYQAGIVLVPLAKAVPDGTEVVLEFDWSPMMKGSGKMDAVTLTVYVTNNGETREFPIDEHDVPTSQMQWVHATVDLSGLTLNESTVIEILPDQQGLHWSTEDRAEDGSYSTWRFFLDNIVIQKKQ